MLFLKKLLNQGEEELTVLLNDNGEWRWFGTQFVI